MALDRKIEVAKLVTREGVCPALNNHDVGHVEGADPAHYFLEELNVGDVIHALLQRNVRSKEFADPLPYLL